MKQINKININPNKELFIWGPIDARPVYPDIWYSALTQFGKRFVAWPSFLMWVHEEKITFICDYKQLRDIGEENFKKFILADNEFRKNYNEWQTIIKEFLKYTVEKSKTKIENMNKAELRDVFNCFFSIYQKFWVIGLLPELSNWGGEQMLRKELSKKIKNEKEFSFVLERLSAPEDYSFYQEEELDLLKIKRFENNKKEFDKKLAEHRQKFFWLLNSYHHTKILSVEHFKKELSALSVKEAPGKLMKITALKENILKEKKKLIETYSLSKDVEKIMHRLAFCIWWQDNRKKHIFIANHFIDELLEKVSEIYNIPFDDLHYYRFEDLTELLNNHKLVHSSEIKTRKDYHMRNYYNEENINKFFSGEEVEEIIKPFVDIKIDKNLKEFKGISVSIGNKSRIKGTVKLVKSGKEISKINKGDVLVTPMTAPDYVVGMRKAIAIITDEGGMTCHAAIVSRELGIPCIVGTKIATKVLKDSDVVEVDGENGVVKILKRGKS